MNFGHTTRWEGPLVIAYLALLAIVVLFSLALYALPYLIARHRRHFNQTAIGLVTLFLGWTTLGWIAALIWAVTDPEPRRS